MGQKAGLFGKVAIFGMIVLGVNVQVLAEVRPEVVERISPVGKVEVAGETKPAEASPVASKEPVPAAAPTAEAAPVAEVAPAAAPAVTGSDGAALYASKGCGACHGADGRKTVMSTYPALAGQGSQYLVAQMNDIKSGARNNGQSMIMKGVIAQVSESEIQAIADWLSGL